MLYILDLIIGTVSGIVAVFPLMIAFHHATLKKSKPNNKRAKIIYIFASYIFCAALFAILTATGIPAIYSSKVHLNFNFVPFSDIFTNYKQYILNIILFIPFGFLLPMQWNNFRKKRCAFIAGMLLSLFIEIMQIFSLRATDIDDLLMNTLGTIAGYYLFTLVSQFFPKISVFSDGTINRRKWEPCVYIAFAFLVMLFVQPFIAEWIWGLIL